MNKENTDIDTIHLWRKREKRWFTCYSYTK